MEITLDDILKAGYQLKAAPRDAWRNYDERSPMPLYFDFDWLSARHPDLYHAFAQTTIGLMNELDSLVDLSGLEVIEGGAGTGRAVMAAAKKAKRVTALDAYESVAFFGRDRVTEAGLQNVDYIRAESASIPFADNSFDAYICSWADLSYPEVYRVLRAGGYLFELGFAPGTLCGELTAVLADEYPQLITEVAPFEQFEAGCPAQDTVIQTNTWNELPVTPPVTHHDFTYRAEYGNEQEAASIYGRLYGATAKHYLLSKHQSWVSWRLRITICRVKKF